MSSASSIPKCGPPQDGDPLPDHYQIVRLGPRPGDEEYEFKPKAGETSVGKVTATGKKEPGFSVQAPASDASAPLTADAAAAAAKDEFKRAFHVNKKDVSTVSVADLRANGFEVVKDSTPKLPSHATIIKQGGGEWGPDDAAKLESIFTRKRLK